MGFPWEMSIDITHKLFHHHGRRLLIKLVLYGATVCIHVHSKINVRSKTLYHLTAEWTVLQITGLVDVWGSIR